MHTRTNECDCVCTSAKNFHACMHVCMCVGMELDNSKKTDDLICRLLLHWCLFCRWLGFLRLLGGIWVRSLVSVRLHKSVCIYIYISTFIFVFIFIFIFIYTDTFSYNIYIYIYIYSELSGKSQKSRGQPAAQNHVMLSYPNRIYRPCEQL